MSETTPEPEEWRPIPGYEAIYEASSLGRVRRLPKIMKATKSHDHLKISLCKDGVVNQRGLHQVIAATFIGPCPPGEETRHLNDDPLDNRACNLKYGDRAANMQDAIRNGRNPKLAKTHCDKGHEYTADNILWYRGSRDCKKCKYAQVTRWQEANPEKVREVSRQATARYRARKRAERQAQ